MSLGAKEVTGGGGGYQLKVITSSDNPVLSCNESSSTYGYIGDVKCPQKHLCVVVVYMDFAVVEGTQNPIFSGMKINSFDAIGSTGQELFDFCSLGLLHKIKYQQQAWEREREREIRTMFLTVEIMTRMR
jgi:hypothetical protein